MADAVFRVAADMAQYIAGMAKADAATKKVARSASNIGDAVGASIVKIEVLNRALNAAGRAISGVVDKATGAARSAGERAIDLATDLGGLGVRDINATVRRVSRGGRAGTTADENTQLVRSLAQAVKQRGGNMSGDEVDSLINAFLDFGEFGFGRGGEDLVRGVAEGQPLSQIMQAGQGRFQRVSAALTDPMSPVFQGMRGRLALNEAQAAEEKAFLVSGTSESAQQAAMRRRAAMDPGGPVSIVQGALGDTAATMLNRAMTSAVGGEDAAVRATERAAAASLSMVEQWRKTLTSPNFATETR